MNYTKTQTQAIHHYLYMWSKHYHDLLTEADQGLITLPAMDRTDIEAKLAHVNKMYQSLDYSGQPSANDHGPIKFRDFPKPR